MQVKLSKCLSSSIQNIHNAKNTESNNIMIRNRSRLNIACPVHSGEEPLFLIYEHSHIQTGHQLPGKKTRNHSKSHRSARLLPAALYFQEPGLKARAWSVFSTCQSFRKPHAVHCMVVHWTYTYSIISDGSYTFCWGVIRLSHFKK